MNRRATTLQKDPTTAKKPLKATFLAVIVTFVNSVCAVIILVSETACASVSVVYEKT